MGAGLPALRETDPRVLAFVESMRETNDHITSNTKKEVKTYLDGVEAKFGRDLRDRTAHVIAHFRQYYQRRGTTISELNANAAFLRGFLTAMVDAGVTEKMWVSQRDYRVRKTHRLADGQVVPIHAKFQVGEAQLLHPADPLAPNKERLGCRCFMVPVSVVPFPEGPRPRVE
jgi:hypothetical protein